MDRDVLRHEITRCVRIEAAIGESVELVPSRDKLRGRCPVHPDHDQTLYVDPRCGVYLCYSCRRSGDVIRWVMEHKGLPEDEALRELARHADIKTGF